jgi:hypothetical protein
MSNAKGVGCAECYGSWTELPCRTIVGIDLLHPGQNQQQALPHKIKSVPVFTPDRLWRAARLEPFQHKNILPLTFVPQDNVRCTLRRDRLLQKLALPLS